MKRGVMEVRIVGICPVMEVVDQRTGEVRGEQPMFWIHFEQARNYLAGYRIYNPNNYAQRITYDDAFIKRFFSSLIYKQDNTMDRRIADYEQGIDALLEAEDIKNDIFTFEHDLWEQ
jgi:gliding motility associated protien GldN